MNKKQIKTTKGGKFKATIAESQNSMILIVNVSTKIYILVGFHIINKRNIL